MIIKIQMKKILKQDYLHNKFKLTTFFKKFIINRNKKNKIIKKINFIKMINNIII